MEVKSKEDYFRLAAKHLKQALDNVIVAQDSITVVKDYTLEAMDWLRAGAALIPDESKTIQGLKAALVESLQREEGLRARLASSEAAEFKVVEKKLAESLKREKELEDRLTYSAAEFKVVEKKLAESIKREKALEARLDSSEAAEAELKVVEKRLAESLQREKEQRLVAAMEKFIREARKLTPSGGHEGPVEPSGPGYTADGNWDVGPAQ